MTSRAEPLSIESLLQETERRERGSCKERANLAIARRAAELKEQREREERAKREKEALEREAEEIRQRERERERATRYGGGNARPDDGDRYGHPDKDSRYGRRDGRGKDDRRPPPQQPKNGFENVPTGPRADRLKSSNATPSNSTPTSTPAPHPPASVQSEVLHESTKTFVPPMTESDLSAVRDRYLGVTTKKRKIRKMNDRKFVFDWAEEEDTLAVDSPIAVGASRQGAQVMFGRGRVGGMDDGGASMPGRAGHANLVDAIERRKAAKSGLDERHWSEKPLHEMKDRDWRIFREDFSIAGRGGSIPHPLRSWAESSIPQIILDVIEKIGYKEPSPIQRQAIPIGLQNRDIIGIAETGSGKTAAFVIPMLTFISKLPPFTDDNRHLGPYALILAPTRELAQQIEAETRKFAGPLGFRCVSIVGGRAMEEQQFNLREGAEIIIATPGRLKDVIERHVIVLSQCRYIVMDEADRMVHLGFEADLLFILDKLPSGALEGEETNWQEDAMDVDGEDGSAKNKGRTRVTTLFSATMPPAVERLARKYLKRPATITIGEAGRAVDTVEQRVEFVIGDEKKRQRVLEILNSGIYPSPIIVFVNQKKTADMVAKELSRGGWSTATLHSGKTQEQREASLQSLRSGDADVLVATDLAGRGIDVQDVSLVINYQMAGTIEAYVHRIGRTGRAGKQGTAITFLTNDDDEVMYDLKQEIAKSPVSKVPPELARHEAAQHKVSREMKRKREAEDLG
ncbi:P-loop containing nucleoside triphosphate hydrolase protein [Pisolithus orientalis]|uniref:P-loop containing nucleoside triphosphate hydrolase protein n=1 Tax=Pisolithus orientalis TaxID=936130 RepID=UPI002225469C|nr:P-loop containing nucleoside triphosphate hydrolase protein [Pisolithus orientalis]KAI6028766.1 P-loop containing nucleoside triphosphate hydrolase protein [Pisolithus orientalis]